MPKRKSNDPYGLDDAFGDEPERSDLALISEAILGTPEQYKARQRNLAMRSRDPQTFTKVTSRQAAQVGRVIAEHFTEKSASEGMYHPPTMSSDTPCHQCKNQQLDQYALTHPETGTYRCSYCGMTYSHVCLGTDTDRKEYQRAVFERNDRDDLIRIVERQGPNWVVNTLTAEGYFTNGG
jgi:hypothetical protein